jgi:sugar phosphate isomerase/epimerase
VQLSGSNYGMPEIPIDRALAFHAELGLGAIELTVLPGYATALDGWTAAERRRVRQWLREHRIEVSGVADFQSLVDPDRAAAEVVLAHHRGAVDLAADLAWGDAPPLVPFTSGGRVDEWPAVRSRLVDRIGALATYARARGVTLVLKAHASGAVSRPHQLIDLIEQVGTPAIAASSARSGADFRSGAGLRSGANRRGGFRLCFDMSHFEVQGLSIEQGMYPLLALSAHVEVKASIGRAPEQRYMIPGEPGTQSDFPAQFRAMAALGYRGYVVPEMSVHVYRRPGYDPYAAMRLACATLAELIPAEQPAV